MKHQHYKKPVKGLDFIDVYRVLELFEVADPCLQHAIKKLLCAGQRGAKDMRQDVQEAIDTLQRRVEMWGELEYCADADGWVEHKGNTKPFGLTNQMVEFKLASCKYSIMCNRADDLFWDQNQGDDTITHWRLKRES